MGRRNIAPEIKSEIVRRYTSEKIGMLCLAREFGVNLTSVSNWIHQANVKPRRPGLRVDYATRNPDLEERP